MINNNHSIKSFELIALNWITIKNAIKLIEWIISDDNQWISSYSNWLDWIELNNSQKCD